ALELLQALSRNCSCVVTAEGVRLSTCPPHEMLSLDQRAIDGLLFARRIAPRLRTEEFNPAASEVGAASSRHSPPPVAPALLPGCLLAQSRRPRWRPARTCWG